jgi:GNAT superfamily N-acetyltransferase
MQITWKIKRLDENFDQSPATSECLLQIKGAIECDSKPAGSVDAFYLYADEPESTSAFADLWDLDATACRVFEEIIDTERVNFREPLAEFLGAYWGILCVNFIALHPPFRRRGLGREVLDELVRNFADDRVGAVLLNAQPLQHTPHGYDHFDEEVRDLPWNTPEEDLARLKAHFRTWDMRILPGTRYLYTAPESLIGDLSKDWYPGLLWGG